MSKLFEQAEQLKFQIKLAWCSSLEEAGQPKGPIVSKESILKNINTIDKKLESDIKSITNQVGKMVFKNQAKIECLHTLLKSLVRVQTITSRHSPKLRFSQNRLS